MKQSIIAAAAGLAALSFATVCHAQTAPAPAAPVAAVDPVRLDLAKQVFEAVGGAKGAEAQMRSLYTAIGAAVGRNMPADQTKVTRQVMGDIQEEVVKLVPSIIDISARVYARNLTEKELRDVLAFYKSDSGQVMVHKQPVMMQQAIAEELPMIQAMMPRVMQKTLDRACEEAKCTPEVRQIVADALTKAMQTPHS
jgi:hypothetical protein